jgi:hypothetical protein
MALREYLPHLSRLLGEVENGNELITERRSGTELTDHNTQQTEHAKEAILTRLFLVCQ